jgi:hypothetical protein
MNFSKATPKPLGKGVSAFPIQSAVGQHGITAETGMDLRDYFAARMMSQMEHRYSEGHSDGWDGMASMAYAYADAMLRVRQVVKP